MPVTSAAADAAAAAAAHVLHSHRVAHLHKSHADCSRLHAILPQLRTGIFVLSAANVFERGCSAGAVVKQYLWAAFSALISMR
jgi:hypothetical protein